MEITTMNDQDRLIHKVLDARSHEDLDEFDAEVQEFIKNQGVQYDNTVDTVIIGLVSFAVVMFVLYLVFPSIF